MALVRYGDSKQDALAMIAAARIMKEVGDSPSKAAVVKGSGQTTSADKKTDTLTVEAILARAKQYAGDRKDLVALAEDAARVGGRGAVHGPGRKSTLVYRGTQDVYQVAFRGGEPAIVFAAGDGDSDLDLYVYDENENLICSDTDLTDRMLCRWSPRWTGQFTIKVKNLGMANYYTIVHN
ncbi:hypothetical protein [Candidatus Symbiobacter mobilis]|nr:hypothetical protein [Candidatus Symbiobacter mobilis]